ncbi:MAG: hypothetical protein LLG00_15850 [Planctomycetaceae bacterium]|nr:hypothetical protein [Planctomycetaceae bacterium]
MSIRCVCQNGHVLTAKDSLAGAVGLCPACRARVQIPTPRRETVSEDAIIAILGDQQPADGGSSPGVTDSLGESWPFAETPVRGIDSKSQPEDAVKACQRCHQKVLAHTHICPHCHAYIANLDDF